MSKVAYLHPDRSLTQLLAEHPEAEDLAGLLAHLEQQLGQEAMELILEYFQAETEAESAEDPCLLEVVAKIEAFERSRGC